MIACSSGDMILIDVRISRVNLVQVQADSQAVSCQQLADFEETGFAEVLSGE